MKFPRTYSRLYNPRYENSIYFTDREQWLSADAFVSVRVWVGIDVRQKTPPSLVLKDFRKLPLTAAIDEGAEFNLYERTFNVGTIELGGNTDDGHSGGKGSHIVAITPLPLGKASTKPSGRVPRIARLLALVHHCRKLIRDGVIINHSELAHYGQISTTRMSQIMWLDNLAPDIQEAILDLARTVNGRDPILEKDLRPIAKTHDWREQREIRVRRL